MYAIVDIESTGRIPGRHELLTIACILADEDLNIVDEFHRGMRPEYKDWWDEEAEGVHGISFDRALKFKTKQEVLSDFIAFCSQHDGFLSMICHAVPMGSCLNNFDRNFIFYWFEYLDARFSYYRIFDERAVRTTIHAGRKRAQIRYGIKSQKLDTWIEKLGLKKRGSHSALEDARITLEVFRYQQKVDGRNLQWEKE